MTLKAFARCILVLFVIAVAVPCFAEGDPVAAGLKFALEKSVGKLAEMGYKTNCKAKNLDYKSDDSWYCGAFATLSGQNEAEYKERVAHQLSAIRTELANISEGITAIEQAQELIYNQNEQILLRLDEIGPETIVGKAVSRTRTVFNDQYVPLFTGERPFTAESLRAFAHQVIFVDRIHVHLGDIHDQLTRTQVGKDPLLRSYAKRLSKRMEEQKSRKLDSSYEYMESILDGLLAEQRKGYILYVWAAETMQSDCEMTGRCDDYHNLPHTATQFAKLFNQHVVEQLAELNAALEWQVLAWSDEHSRNPNFLHPDAARLFERADLFVAGNVPNGAGLRGRVITMGDLFDGKLKVDNTELSPWGPTNSVATNATAVDYWKASSPGVYDELHFGNRWKIYHYFMPQAASGSYTITTPMPYRPAAIRVAATPVAENVSYLVGSFTAIQRAGGGYALLSGGWHQTQLTRGDVIGENHSLGDDKFFDAGPPAAGVKWMGRIEWKFKDTGKDQHIEGERASHAVSNKVIHFPQGGEVGFHVDFADTYRTLCPHADCAEFPPNSVLMRTTDFSKSPANRDAELKARTVVLLDNAHTGSNGFVWNKDNSTGGALDEIFSAAKETKRITLEKNGKYHMIVGGWAKLNVQTSGFGETFYRVVAVAKIDNAYVMP
jgi:hypothetical protein